MAEFQGTEPLEALLVVPGASYEREGTGGTPGHPAKVAMGTTAALGIVGRRALRREIRTPIIAAAPLCRLFRPNSGPRQTVIRVE